MAHTALGSAWSMLRNTSLLAFALLTVAPAPTLAQQAQALDKVVLRINFTPWGMHAQYFGGRAQGFYKEALFNIYCDCSGAKAFEYAKSKIEGLFDDPKLYTTRKYFIP